MGKIHISTSRLETGHCNSITIRLILENEHLIISTSSIQQNYNKYKILYFEGEFVAIRRMSIRMCSHTHTLFAYWLILVFVEHCGFCWNEAHWRMRMVVWMKSIHSPIKHILTRTHTQTRIDNQATISVCPCNFPFKAWRYIEHTHTHTPNRKTWWILRKALKVSLNAILITS